MARGRGLLRREELDLLVKFTTREGPGDREERGGGGAYGAMAGWRGSLVYRLRVSGTAASHRCFRNSM